MENLSLLLSKAKEIGILEQLHKQQTDAANTITEKLSTIPEWCGNNTIHLEKPDTYQDEFCCFNHVIGLPQHPATLQLMPLTPYQIHFCNTVEEQKRLPDNVTEEELQRTPHMFHLNKGRQMGFTEIVLRHIAYNCFHDYAGYKVGIMAATNGSLALKDLRRFARLFKSIPGVVEQWVKRNTMILANGVIIEAFKASEEAITGDTQYKCVFMDEAAKWKLVDDEPVFNSVEPVIEAAGGDLFLVSTPKGPEKKFYSIHKEPKAYYPMEYDIWEAKDNLYTEKEINRKLEQSQGDPLQEYMCKFRFGKDSTLGIVTDDERGQGYEWDYTPETDEYTEPDDFDANKFQFEKDEDGNTNPKFDPDYEWKPE